MQKKTGKISSDYWRNAKRLTSILLLLWFSLTFGCLFFARELSTLHFFSWPLSFYIAAQGLTLSFVFILATYSIGMHWIGRTKKEGDD
ncbi:DUF4212 domain-containing protein [Undibacterium jejuense]|uniref:DUF4212 domain-containing protein n=1 Tax=Undibacterium jejuense TaxID=1344949 RepID=A0A923HLD0_9BURK|nr:sodium/substrate symporter small subunit [Undibacterium jejuense]MBC3863837.1 DUF4212 domain-containing protein [Undibacterium jejuense]